MMDRYKHYYLDVAHCMQSYYLTMWCKDQRKDISIKMVEFNSRQNGYKYATKSVLVTAHSL